MLCRGKFGLVPQAECDHRYINKEAIKVYIGYHSFPQPKNAKKSFL